MEGPEDNGGEGQLGREPGYSGGGQFFPKENLCKLLFAPNFTFTFISESEIRPCTSLSITKYKIVIAACLFFMLQSDIHNCY